MSGYSLSSSVQESWVIQGNLKLKYENIFESLLPVGGKLPGDKVRPVLLNSKLPLDILGKVWELSDIDKDGFLDREEFCVAMYLVYRAIDKDPVPEVLPTNLIPLSKRTPKSPTIAIKTSLPGAVSVLPQIPSAGSVSLKRTGSTSSNSGAKIQPLIPAQPNAQWNVNPADKTRYVGIFHQKRDPDGLINGGSARDVFVQSGLPQPVLAHVWGLCDQNSVGRLNQDQFVFAMHLISQKVKGVELPTQLTQEMLLASSQDSGYGDGGSQSDASSGLGDSAAMRELDALNQEIEELRREKETLTAEIQQKEVAVRNTNNEVQELQDTLDRDSSSLAQLECDKAEAHTRLEELEQQRNKLDTMLADVRLKVQEENENIKSLKAQISAQEATVGQQEIELKRIRSELAELKQEETQLELSLEAEKQQAGTTEKAIKEAQTDIDKVKVQLNQLQEKKKSVSSNIEQYDKAVAALKSESSDSNFQSYDDLNLKTSGVAISESVFSMGGMQEKVEQIQEDLNENQFTSESAFTTDPFAQPDPFGGSDPFEGSDPFSGSEQPAPSDPFAGADPFAASATSGGEDGFAATQSSTNDPFGGKDPFADTTASTFDSHSSVATFNSDPFGNSDPFSTSATSTSNKSAAFDTTSSSNADTFTKEFSPTTAFDPSNFAKAFSDNESTLQTENLFDAFPTNNDKKSDDPWGSAFGGESTSSNHSEDPFGGDAFGSKNNSPFSSDPFSTPVAKPENKAPPRPVKPYDMSATARSNSVNKKKNKQKTEADQLAWAREESKKEEERRRKMREQEEADLKLAIALSQQDG